MNEDLIQKFGYSEMYEWAEAPDQKDRLGRFVGFSKSSPGRIAFYGGNDTCELVGITTINSTADSDNPSEWKYKNMCNEYGDLYLRKEKLAVGQKVYDQFKEMNYIQTSPWEHFIPIPNKFFDSTKTYVKRSNRMEWTRVNIAGKVIVKDNGECKPGEYCTPYVGKLKTNFGIAVPATKTSKNNFYVISRLSDNTILIFNK